MATKLYDFNIEKIRALREQNKNWTEIAKLLKCSRVALGQHMRLYWKEELIRGPKYRYKRIREPRKGSA